MSKYWYLYDVTTRREAQLFIEEALEVGFDINSLQSGMLRHPTQSISKSTRRGEKLVLDEIKRQQRSGLFWLLLGGFGLIIVAVIVIVVIFMITS